ncbi:aromatic hydrocarbon degradation protein [Haematospirillum sp. 15-248]|uniref:OmpP1/FadL family transporter n=1 Tax=Haematospirillum sp. 15-248 TaxID=2723107 RepID=UPI00143A4659|nr:outer membrane protein transport protein [Haematospirillum sp. 15-248]NKD87239.1 aromatic hydrocarbon degradation protein [Haematospirillum sp. 15-248]
MSVTLKSRYRISRACLSLAPALALSLAAGNAAASGFQLREQGSAGQGSSFAGATSSARDLSTIYFNPAGLTRLSGHAAQANMSFVIPSAKFKNNGSTLAGTAALGSNDGGDAGGLELVPSLYALYSHSNDLKFGLGINAPYGLKTDYKSGWQGRFHALKSELKTINVQPTVAYRISNWVSVGGGINIQKADATLSNAINNAVLGGAGEGYTELSGDDWAVGYTMGATIQPFSNTRLGIAYKSRIEHTLEGDVRFSNVGALAADSRFVNTKGSVKLTTPDMLSLGITYNITPAWAVMGEAAWTNWSLFDETRVKKANGSADTVNPENWEDTWFFALGTNYQATDKLDLSFGVAFDEAPVPDGYRTPRIPDSNRVWASLGAGYAITDSINLTGAYTHIWTGKAPISKSSITTDVLRGKFDTSVDIVTLGLTARF